MNAWPRSLPRGPERAYYVVACHALPPHEHPDLSSMDERVFTGDYVHIWMTSASVSEVVARVAAELGLPITAGEVLLMARRLRRDGVFLPTRPGGARKDQLTLVPQPDGDYLDRHGSAAYPVGPGTPIEGPWVCTRCRRPMCGGFMVLTAQLDAHWPVCVRCVHVVE